ncbi:hypothetical protein EB75_05385 [Mycobacterium sp. ST-F2]|nr:hypothetical protein EB75_05385 [Mycobacterium sp. ST-F2]
MWAHKCECGAPWAQSQRGPGGISPASVRASRTLMGSVPTSHRVKTRSRSSTVSSSSSRTLRVNRRNSVIRTLLRSACA